MSDVTKIKLGEVYRDAVSGFVGVATTKTQYLNDPIEVCDLEAKAQEGNRVVLSFSSARLKPEPGSDLAGQYL